MPHLVFAAVGEGSKTGTIPLGETLFSRPPGLPRLPRGPGPGSDREARATGTTPRRPRGPVAPGGAAGMDVDSTQDLKYVHCFHLPLSLYDPHFGILGSYKVSNTKDKK